MNQLKLGENQHFKGWERRNVMKEDRKQDKDKVLPLIQEQTTSRMTSNTFSSPASECKILGDR